MSSVTATSAAPAASNSTPFDNETRYLFSATNGDHETALKMIAAKVNIHARVTSLGIGYSPATRTFLDPSDENCIKNANVIHIAAIAGHETYITTVLTAVDNDSTKAGDTTNAKMLMRAKDSSGNTPLSYAADSNQFSNECLKLMLSFASSVTEPNVGGYTPLHAIVTRTPPGHPEERNVEVLKAFFGRATIPESCLTDAVGHIFVKEIIWLVIAYAGCCPEFIAKRAAFIPKPVSTISQPVKGSLKKPSSAASMPAESAAKDSKTEVLTVMEIAHHQNIDRETIDCLKEHAGLSRRLTKVQSKSLTDLIHQPNPSHHCYQHTDLNFKPEFQFICDIESELKGIKVKKKPCNLVGNNLLNVLLDREPRLQSDCVWYVTDTRPNVSDMIDNAVKRVYTRSTGPNAKWEKMIKSEGFTYYIPEVYPCSLRFIFDRSIQPIRSTFDRLALPVPLGSDLVTIDPSEYDSTLPHVTVDDVLESLSRGELVIENPKLVTFEYLLPYLTKGFEISGNRTEVIAEARNALLTSLLTLKPDEIWKKFERMMNTEFPDNPLALNLCTLNFLSVLTELAKEKTAAAESIYRILRSIDFPDNLTHLKFSSLDYFLKNYPEDIADCLSIIKGATLLLLIIQEKSDNISPRTYLSAYNSSFSHSNRSMNLSFAAAKPNNFGLEFNQAYHHPYHLIVNGHLGVIATEFMESWNRLEGKHYRNPINYILRLPDFLPMNFGDSFATIFPNLKMMRWNFAESLKEDGVLGKIMKKHFPEINLTEVREAFIKKYGAKK